MPNIIVLPYCAVKFEPKEEKRAVRTFVLNSFLPLMTTKHIVTQLCAPVFTCILSHQSL